MKTEPRINRPCFELLITLNKKGNTTGGKKNVTQSYSLKSFWTHITNYKIICPFKHPASKFNVNSLSVNGGRRRVGQGLREGETVIMKNPNNNKMPTPKLKEWPGTLLCNQSLQSLESLRTLYNSEKLSKSWESETNDVILQLRANESQIIGFPINSLPQESLARSPDGLCTLNCLACLVSIIKPCVTIVCLHVI